ncbi:uncharacterized protein EKO05_0002071 [Ascochyta rabiei]|uniref:uncharacterized protein n=1 Tax=Didymella rabiei TaxID=5454 RepID=UPI00220E9DA9|nr:uncharacterized protein EKO05_0002071 [Ascochyta rabiei]UPX11465.1 hypothetical protein EKO05_0002071 [Ascochyta rabiei]
MADHITQNTVRGTTRKKAVEACERCRGKRIKCNGFQPCNQCLKKNAHCDFAIAPLPTTGGTEALGEKLDLIIARLESIEQRLNQQSQDDNAHVSSPVLTPGLEKPQLLALHPNTRGVVKLNQQTGCFEYYGRTSTFQIASALGKRLEHTESTSTDISTTKKRRIELVHSSEGSPAIAPKALDLDELTSFCDYIVPPHALRSDRRLQLHITDRHLQAFFCTIHLFLPVLDQARFRLSRPQFVCLMYAVLALGALYEDGEDDSPAWASWYFGEAQSMLGRLLDASNLELTQAATFLGAYAQHAIKPNLAYNLNGIAARLGYSIGLNVESLHRSLGFDKEEARRTWAIIYIQEVELSLDSGRPMSIRSADMNMNYPTMQLPVSNESSTNVAQVVFIGHLANISKIVLEILKISSVHEERPLLLLEEREALRQQLERWRDSLPNFLSFEDGDRESPGDNIKDTSFVLEDWRARQQSSLRIHFNLANIILLRSAVSMQNEIDPGAADCPLIALHRKICLDAARDMITHIHRSFKLAPGLRRWTYYCFYCLQATLILLPQSADDRDASDDLFCTRAVEIFEQIKLKASQRCADVVRQYLRKRTTVRDKQKQETATHCSDYANQTLRSSRSGSALQRPEPATAMPYGFLAQNQSCGDFANETQDCELDTAGLLSFDIGRASWPSVSPTTFQNEMYGALYDIDPNDDFQLGHQSFFLGPGGSLNDMFTDDTNDWTHLWTN